MEALERPSARCWRCLNEQELGWPGPSVSQAYCERCHERTLVLIPNSVPDSVEERFEQLCNAVRNMLDMNRPPEHQTYYREQLRRLLLAEPRRDEEG